MKIINVLLLGSLLTCVEPTKYKSDSVYYDLKTVNNSALPQLVDGGAFNIIHDTYTLHDDSTMVEVTQFILMADSQFVIDTVYGSYLISTDSIQFNEYGFIYTGRLSLDSLIFTDAVYIRR